MRRLSVMFLGTIGGNNYDMRVRTDSSGKSEVVLKKGCFHGHDCEEYSVKISKEQIAPFIQMFSKLGFESKVTERVNEVYELPNGATLVWVKAKHISYIELEKMTDKINKRKDTEKLKIIMDNMEMREINKVQFDNICARLTREVDLVLKPGSADVKKISRMLKPYL
ncbi:hypothetical protein KGQ31_01175 [Patescibacteria group bacterium]|nr:hypothetical protein [Patescibacteria group bacterium]